MGNKNTNLNIDRFFDENPYDTRKSYQIKINLTRPSITESGEEIYFVYLVLQNGNLYIVKSADKVDFEFTPKSHMRDFEVIVNPNTGSHDKVARDQGICCMMIYPINTYIKLIYNKTESLGVSPISFNTLGTNDERKNVLNSDLSLGYNVFIIDNEEAVYNLCEELDDRDDKETLILFDEFKEYASY